MKNSTAGLLVAGAMALAVPGTSMAQGMITVGPPPAAEEPTERPVTISDAQAASGSDAYDRYCVICHGPNLNDGEFGGPPLRGLSFDESFGELPVSVLYSYIHATMPPDRPGQISHRDRTDIIAYILSRNGYAEGTPLPYDVQALDLLILEK